MPYKALWDTWEPSGENAACLFALCTIFRAAENLADLGVSSHLTAADSITLVTPMRSEPFLGKVVTSFRQAYPEVRTLRLEVTHRGEVRHESQRKDVYSGSGLPSKIPCPNPLCRDGGYDLNAILMTLTHGKTTSYQTTWSCRGREGSRRTQANPYPCMNSVEVSIEIAYQE